jgi:N-acetylneuraminic acid mutarotase
VTAQVLRWHLPRPVSREVAMPYGTSVLIAGGLGPGDVSTARVLSVNVGSGVVRVRSDLVQPLHDSAGVVLAGHPTVFGGGAATELDVVQSMNRHGTWAVVGHLPQARSDLSVAATTAGSSRAVVVGGYDGSRTPTTILGTTDGAHFRPLALLRSGIRYAGVASWRGRVWVFGGEVAGRELDEVLRVDVGTGRVRQMGRLPRPLGHETVVPVGDRMLVLGGRSAPRTVTDQMWWYEPAGGGWTRAGRLPYPVADAPSVAVGGVAFLFGGETPDFTDRVTRVRWHS